MFSYLQCIQTYYTVPFCQESLMFGFYYTLCVDQICNLP